jgi:hypothetical protein
LAEVAILHRFSHFRDTKNTAPTKGGHAAEVEITVYSEDFKDAVEDKMARMMPELEAPFGVKIPMPKVGYS